MTVPLIAGLGRRTNFLIVLSRLKVIDINNVKRDKFEHFFNNLFLAL
jgi:hypothetical protein